MRLNTRLSRKGLTLTEILVVVFIFSTLSTILFTIFKSALDSWRKSENMLTVYQEARTALDMISREVSSAYLSQGSADSSQWTKFYGIDEAGTRIKTNSAKDELFFVAPVAVESGEPQRMDLCEIGYWLDGKGTAEASDDTLMRHFKAFEKPPVAYNFRESPAGVDSAIARNVTDLQFTYYYRGSSGAGPTSIAKSWDSDSDNLAGGENYDANGNAKNPDGLPEAVGISITVRSRDGTFSRTFTGLTSIAVQ